jgi:DNA replication and repair protein RecF
LEPQSVRVLSLTLRDFRSYHDAEASLGPGLTVVSGPNGAGKTNLLEAIYFGSVGRSPRTANERELVRFGASMTRVVVRCQADDGPHEIAVGFEPGEPKRLRVDGATVERLLDAPERPLVSVFLPDRLDLIKGAPALRRAHLDQLVAALWPSRVETRRSYLQVLSQRNALISRVRSGSGSRASLSSWDAQLAQHGIALMGDRRHAVEAIAERSRGIGERLGFDVELAIGYRPRSKACEPEQLRQELAERIDQDLDRGFSGHGPHRDELATQLGGRDLRAFGSQGQQRLALLALLLAEREAIAEQRSSPPVMLLDDVMSELDHTRREALVALLRTGGGQSVITTTDLEHVPGAKEEGVTRLSLGEGRVLGEAIAAAGGLRPPPEVGEPGGRVEIA